MNFAFISNVRIQISNGACHVLIVQIEMPIQHGGTLAELAVGARAIVDDVDAEGRMALRLLEMGFVPGVEVALVKRAPLGDPLELRLRGYHVSLRRAEAAAITVRPLGEPRA
jgi:ferrous iron transport protein A